MSDEQQGSQGTAGGQTGLPTGQAGQPRDDSAVDPLTQPIFPGGEKPQIGGQGGEGSAAFGGTLPGVQDDQGLLTDFTGAKFDPNKIVNTPIPAHTLQFDEKLFLELLASSVSLTFTEKLQIIQTIPKLQQWQIDELLKILQDEKAKFSELNQKHVQKLKELEVKHQKEWEQLEMKAEEAMQQESDHQKADAIRKELGLE